MGLGSGIRKKPIPDPESRGQKGTGSRIQIRNTEKISEFEHEPSQNTEELKQVKKSWNQCLLLFSTEPEFINI